MDNDRPTLKDVYEAVQAGTSEVRTDLRRLEDKVDQNAGESDSRFNAIENVQLTERAKWNARLGVLSTGRTIALFGFSASAVTISLLAWLGN